MNISRGFPIVPAELKLAEVAIEVLYRDLMEAAYDAALQQAPVAINRPGMDFAANPFLRAVVDRFVVVNIGRHPTIQSAVICIDGIRSDRHVVFDFLDYAF